MKPAFASARANLLLCSESCISACQISSKTTLDRSIVARVIKELLPEKENIKLGCFSKLSSIDRRKIVSSVTWES